MKKIGLIVILSFIIVFIGQATTTYSVGASRTYTTITAAYEACTGSDDYIIEIYSDYTTEALPISLGTLANKSSVNTVTIRPQSGVSGLTISGSATSIFYLNGADYLIIDGRPGGTGSADFIIQNTSTSATRYAIQFINDATYNTIKYCTINGSSATTSNTSAVVHFSTSTGTTGNDFNTITNCTIKKAGSNRPANSITSVGSGSRTNSDNTISYCNIIDFTNSGIKYLQQ